MQHLEAQKNISAFALLLTGTDEGSYLALGMPEPSWYNHESLVWTNAKTDLWWALEGSVHVQGSNYKLDGFYLLDSGTSYIGAPGEQFDLLVNEILPWHSRSLCKVMEPSGIRFCFCEVIYMAKTLNVHIGGVEFPVGPAALFGQVDKNTCVLQVMRLKDGMPLILGDSFLRTVAAIFDVRGRRIGLAKRSDLVLIQPHPDWKRLCLGAFSVVCFIVSLSALCYLLICDRQSGKEVPPAREAQENCRPVEPYTHSPAVVTISEVSTPNGNNISEKQAPREYSMPSWFRVCVPHRHSVAVADEATINKITHDDPGASDAPYQRL